MKSIKTQISLIPLIISLLTLVAFSQEEAFDLKAWKSTNSTKSSVGRTKGGDLSPFQGNTKEGFEARFTTLGPLGLKTIMYDRSWGAFSGVRKSFAKSLSLKDELIYNHFTVLSIKPGSPAEGKVVVGDKIVAIEGQLLEGGQTQYLDQLLKNRYLRGIEMHAGRLIDQAEGKGCISLTILREKKEGSIKLAETERKWGIFQSVKSVSSEQFSIPLPASGLIKIRPIKCNLTDLHFADTMGNKIKLIPNKGSLEKTICDIPGENWQLKGIATTKKGECAFEILVAKAPKSLSEKLKAGLIEVDLKIDAMGSFGNKYDPNCKKARNYSAMLAHRLVTEQLPKGDWEVGGMSDTAFQTSAIGLALMSTDDPQYVSNIRKAAYFVGHKAERHHWSYPRGIELTFLAEYYLRYKDPKILPLLRHKMNIVRDYVYNDYTSGHGKGNPGYKGKGYIGAGSVIACGLATACKTPIATDEDKALLYNMMSRIEGLAPRGITPYSRAAPHSPSQLLRLSKKDISYQGGGCGTGGYIAAAIISGWKGNFYKSAMRRHRTAPYGTSEWGHATQTLHFFWGLLSANYAGEETFKETMNAYLWKFTTYREFDGFVNGNNTRTDLHGGDNVIGAYWRNASFLLILNAHKKNLAITGKLHGNDKKIKTHISAVNYGRHKYLLQNWILVKNQLGSRAPESLLNGVEHLKQLNNTQMNDLNNYITKTAPVIVQDIVNLEQSSNGVTNGQLAELILGISVEVRCLYGYIYEALKMKGKSEARKKRTKELKKKSFANKGPIEHYLRVVPCCVFQKNPNIYYTGIKNSIYKLSDLKISVTPADKKNISKKTSKESDIVFFKMIKGSSTKLNINVSYKVNDIKIGYKTQFVAEITPKYIPYLTQVELKGELKEDFSKNYDIRLALKSGETLDFEFSKNYTPPHFFEAGKYKLTVSPGSQWGLDIKSIQAISPNQKRFIKFTTAKGTILNDNNTRTSIDLKLGDQIVMDFAKDEKVRGINLDCDGKRESSVKFEALVEGKWVLISSMPNKPSFGWCLPVVTSKIRLTYNIPAPGKYKDRPFTVQDVKFMRAK